MASDYDGWQPPVRRLPKASELLVAEIRREIIGGRLTAGTRLRAEAELVAESGFSRATVREALRVLESDGLISVHRGPKGGVIVAQPDTQQVTRALALVLARSDAELSSLISLRKLLEPAAAAALAEDATVEQRIRIERSVSSELGVQNTVDFHVVLAETSSNPLMSVLLTVLNDLLDLHAPDEALTTTDLASATSQHSAIAQAISAGDAAAASREMLRHIERFERALGRQNRLGQLIFPRTRMARQDPSMERSRVVDGTDFS